MWAAGCGGVTDIGFQGYDNGTGATAAVGGIGGTGGGLVDGGAGGTGGVGGTSVGGTAGTSVGGTGNVGGTGPVTCGGVVCPPPSIPIGQVESCCAPGNKCGLTSSFLGGQCIELDQPGKPDATCPPMSVQGFNLPGCCKPNGFCGLLDNFLGLGCVDPTDFGMTGEKIKCGGVIVDAGTGGTGGTGGDAGTDASTGGTGGGPADAGADGMAPGELFCGSNFSPGLCAIGQKCCVLSPGQDYCSAPTAPCVCTGGNCAVIDVTCDGNEDCPGQMCCGIIQGNAYTKTVCQASCNGTTEREICHPGGTCVTPGKTCSHPQALPQYIWRCN